MKVLTIVLGVILLVGGIYCLITPIATYSAISWLIGIAMAVDGISNVITWNERRKLGLADGWTLAGGIVSLILGIFLLCSFVAQFAVDLFIAYLIAAWLIVGGITRIFASLKIRDYGRSMGGASLIGSNWTAVLLLGIVIAALGVLCLIEPAVVMVGIGVMLGISIIAVGVGLLVRGVRM